MESFIKNNRLTLIVLSNLVLYWFIATHPEDIGEWFGKVVRGYELIVK